MWRAVFVSSMVLAVELAFCSSALAEAEVSPDGDEVVVRGDRVTSTSILDLGADTKIRLVFDEQGLAFLGTAPPSLNVSLEGSLVNFLLLVGVSGGSVEGPAGLDIVFGIGAQSVSLEGDVELGFLFP